MEERRAKNKTGIYRNFLLGFLIPPPIWFLLNYLAGTFSLEMVLKMLLFPSLYLYVILFVYMAVRLLRARIRKLEFLHSSASEGEVDEVLRHFNLVQRGYFFLMFAYVLPGPIVVMVNIYQSIGFSSFIVAWLTAIPLILIYTTPFTIGFLKHLALYAQDLPFSRTRRSLRFSRKINLILGQNAIGVVLVLLLMTYHIEHQFGREANFSEVLLFRISLIGLSSLAIIITNLFLFDRGITQSVTQLRDNLNQLVGKGADLTRRLEVLSRDEMGEMAHDFNEFVGSIETVVADARRVGLRLIESAEEMTDLTFDFSEKSGSQTKTLEEVSERMDRISASVENIAGMTEQESKSLDAFSVVISGLDDITEKMSGGLERVLAVSRNTAELARRGDESLRLTEQSMRNVDESASQIADVVRMIREVSEQIDLLALNASIEAARAGDVGRGFAVVAEEISRLAVLTAGRIQEIDRLVDKNDRDVRNGVESVGSTLKLIEEIMGDTGRISESIAGLNALMQDQVRINQEVQKQTGEVRSRAEKLREDTGEQKENIVQVSDALHSVSNAGRLISEASKKLMKNAASNEGMARQLMERVETFNIEDGA